MFHSSFCEYLCSGSFFIYHIDHLGLGLLSLEAISFVIILLNCKLQGNYDSEKKSSFISFTIPIQNNVDQIHKCLYRISSFMNYILSIHWVFCDSIALLLRPQIAWNVHKSTVKPLLQQILYNNSCSKIVCSVQWKSSLEAS